MSIICIYLILAAPNVPTDLVFNNNATPNYDEGVFTLNWTSGAGDAESNYTIYVFSNSSIYLIASNDSVTGYSFSNTTEANYTFIVEAINETGFGANSSNISIYVDTTAPVITLPFYTNVTKKKNTESLILNISVTDATSGLTNGVCLIDVNGTNQSVSISSGWCNASNIALTGLTDGNKTIKVWVNDSTNNIGLNDSYVVEIDTTAPVITLPFYTNATKKKNTESLILNISVTDATSGLANGVCLIDANGTNQSVSISSGWCNASNIALTGLSDGNRTINVWVNDSTNNIGLNNSYVVEVDTTAPVITLPFYTNGTKKKNTESLILNISVTDATSGLTNGVCLIDANGTNKSVSISSGWCNSSAIALTGLSDGNRTINVWVNDSTNNIGLNNSYVVQIDTTVPVITLPFYTNATKKTNTESLILNISVTDVTSGLTNGVCLIDANGTNQSVSISSGWCNASNIALTGLADGNQTIRVWVNDSTNNIGLNNSYVVQVDGTAPVITLNSSSALTDSLTLVYSTSEGSCTVNRGTISGSTIVEYRLDCETSYSYTLNCTDSNGNSATLTESFSTSSCSSGGSSSGSTSSPSYWLNTLTNEGVNFVGGITKELAVKNRMRIELNGTDHYVGVMELTSTTAKISVNSVPQEALFSIGDTKKFDVDNNGFYDVLIILNSIINNQASVTALPIYEKIVSEVVEEAEVVTSTPTTEVPEEEIVQEEIASTNIQKDYIVYGILIGLIILALIGYYFITKNKNKNKIKKLKK